MDKLKERLRVLTGKKHILLTKRGNAALYLALRLAQQQGKHRVLIQDQGGWLTYLEYPGQLGMKTIKLTTDYGLVNAKELEEKATADSVLLINSLVGYVAEQDMEEIEKICGKHGCLVINDISGSIGTGQTDKGDILIGSFRKWKPVNAGYGGFIASDDEISFEDDFEEKYVEKILDCLDHLKERREWLIEHTEKIKKDLADYQVIHKTFKGLVVIVKFNKDTDKPSLIQYCEERNLPYTLCPRYIRMMEEGICIEVKRWQKQ